MEFWSAAGAAVPYFFDWSRCSRKKAAVMLGESDSLTASICRPKKKKKEKGTKSSDLLSFDDGSSSLLAFSPSVAEKKLWWW